MILSIFRYLDIFFTIITIVLYITFLFYTSSLNSKFLIFFISSFMNIFCYSSVLKDEYNFFLITLLNVVIILIIIFYYFNIDLKEDLLPEEFIARNYFRYTIIIGSFLFSLFCLMSISLTFLKKKNVIVVNNSNIPIIGKVLKNKFNQVNINYIDDSIQLYNKKIDGFNSKIFKNYNILIIIYMFFLTIYFFISKNEENINFFQDEQLAERKLEELLIHDIDNGERYNLKVGDNIGRKKTLVSKKRKENIEEENNYSLVNKGKSWWSNDDDIDENDIYRLNRRRKQDESSEDTGEDKKTAVRRKKIVNKKKKQSDDGEEK